MLDFAQMIRGKGSGLEVTLVGRSFPEAFSELLARLDERAGFYRGSAVTAILEPTPTGAQIAELERGFADRELRLEGAHGDSDLEPLLAPLGIAYLGTAPHPAVTAMPATRERRPRSVELSEGARSLVADFEGARSDLAARRVARSERRHGVDLINVEALAPASASNAVAPPVDPLSDVASTLYHRGTLRGGQSLSNRGHVVIIGDVNPGAEIVAGGDIVVFGALRGVAHAGAQGDRSARVHALDLQPTQLRIATMIAADTQPRSGTVVAEEAFIDGERIAVVASGALATGTKEHTR